MAAANAALTSAGASSAFSRLVQTSIAALRHHVTPTSRLVALDITPTHISLALSDRTQQQAVPFGILARTAKVSADAKILASAFSAIRQHAPEEDHQQLPIHALVVGVSPDRPDVSIDYTRELMHHQTFFPHLNAILFYSEAHALQHSIHAQRDLINALRLLPDDLETRKLKRFTAAMNPPTAKQQLLDDVSSRAQLGPTDILQAVLRDLNQLKRQQ